MLKKTVFLYGYGFPHTQYTWFQIHQLTEGKKVS